MSNLTHSSSHPDRHDDEPDPGTAGTGRAYRCLDCPAWSGRGAEAYDHHLAYRDHRIVLRDAAHLGPVAFGCCHENVQPVIVEKEPVHEH